MSHILIYCKVFADDAEDGKAKVYDALNESCGEDGTAGFDYVDDEINLLIPEILKGMAHDGKPTPFSSYKEFEKFWENRRHETIKELRTQIEQQLKIDLASRFLSKTEATTMICEEDDNLKQEVEAILKRKKDTRLPNTFEELIAAISGTLETLARDESHVMYLLKQIGRLQRCIDDPDNTLYTLQCPRNHYAVLNVNDKVEGQKAYYYAASRHI